MASEFALGRVDLFEDKPNKFHCVAALFVLFWKILELTTFLYPISPPDINLESFIGNDNFELTESQAVWKSSLTTWIYFDHKKLW
jgi:hypothetical protein